MKRNKELLYAIKAKDVERVIDLLSEEKHNDLCADVNYHIINQDMSPLHLAVTV